MSKFIIILADRKSKEKVEIFESKNIPVKGDMVALTKFEQEKVFVVEKRMFPDSEGGIALLYGKVEPVGEFKITDHTSFKK